MKGLLMAVSFSSQRAAGRFLRCGCATAACSVRTGMCGRCLRFSRGKRQSPAIAAERVNLWGPTQRIVRFGIHRVAPDALLLCHWWVGKAREFCEFCGDFLGAAEVGGHSKEGKSVVPAAPALWPSAGRKRLRRGFLWHG